MRLFHVATVSIAICAFAAGLIAGVLANHDPALRTADSNGQIECREDGGLYVKNMFVATNTVFEINNSEWLASNQFNDAPTVVITCRIYKAYSP